MIEIDIGKSLGAELSPHDAMLQFRKIVSDVSIEEWGRANALGRRSFR